VPPIPAPPAAPDKETLALRVDRDLHEQLRAYAECGAFGVPAGEYDAAERRPRAGPGRLLESGTGRRDHRNGRGDLTSEGRLKGRLKNKLGIYTIYTSDTTDPTYLLKKKREISSSARATE
jgi:hypothetical protein